MRSPSEWRKPHPFARSHTTEEHLGFNPGAANTELERTLDTIVETLKRIEDAVGEIYAGRDKKND